MAPWLVHPAHPRPSKLGLAGNTLELSLLLAAPQTIEDLPAGRLPWPPFHLHAGNISHCVGICSTYRKHLVHCIGKVARLLRRLSTLADHTTKYMGSAGSKTSFGVQMATPFRCSALFASPMPTCLDHARLNFPPDCTIWNVQLDQATLKVTITGSRETYGNVCTQECATDKSRWRHRWRPGADELLC